MEPSEKQARKTVFPQGGTGDTSFFPQPGDSLFVTTPRIPSSDKVYSGTKAWSLTADGYANAALTLIEYVQQIPGVSPLYILPILFLGRHYVELMLKQILWLKIEMLRGQPPSTIPKNLITHDIAELWSRCRPIVARTLHGGDTIADSLSEMILELDKHDPNGDAFRYGFGKDGDALPRDLAVVDLAHFKRGIEKVAMVLATTRNLLALHLQSYLHRVEALHEVHSGEELAQFISSCDWSYDEFLRRHFGEARSRD